MYDYDEYMEKWRHEAFKKHPELWSFYENDSAYEGQSPDDENCKRWQDTLKIASVIQIHQSNVFFFSEPGEMKMSFFEEWDDHNSEWHMSEYQNSVHSVSKDVYDRVRCEKKDGVNTDSELWEIERIFHIESRIKEFLEDDFLVVRYMAYSGLWRYHIDIAARVKGVPGYYIFTFCES